MILIIIFLFLFIRFIYITFNFIIISNISYLLAYIPFLFKYRHKIIIYNIKQVFPNLNQDKIDYIIFNQYKFFFINVFICLNLYLFKDSFIIKNYLLDKFIIPDKKSLIIAAHQGIYYDFLTLYNLIDKKSFYVIYKGNFKFRFNARIKTRQASKTNFNDLKKYFFIYTPIDQKSSDKTLVNFLGKNVNFHSKLIDYAISNNRDIYFYYTIVENNLIKPNLIKIITKNKNLNEVVQDVADKFTEIIKKYPEQYLWHHNRFNI